MSIHRSGLLCCVVLLLCSLMLAQAQENKPSIFGNLEVITPDNLGRLVKLRDLAVVDDLVFDEMSFNADSTLLASGTIGGVWVWSLESGHVTELVKPYGDPIYTPAVFSPTDPNFLATCNTMWDVSKLEPVFSGDFCSDFTFDPMGSFFLAAEPLRLLDAKTGAVVQALPDEINLGSDKKFPISTVSHAAFSPDGQQLAYCAIVPLEEIYTTIVVVMDLTSGKIRSVPALRGSDAPRGAPCLQDDSLFFSLNGRYLYTNLDRGITIFDTISGEVSFSPEPWGGRLIASPDRQLMFDFIMDWENNKGSLEAYDVTTMRQLVVPPNLLNANADISPDGKLLAVYSDKISIWGVPSGD